MSDKKDSYVFPAVLDYADDGISIDFPDIPGCMPCAFSNQEALHNASEALSLHLYNMQEDGDVIPEPSDILAIQHEANQAVILVEADVKKVRAHQSKKSVNVMVTIPEGLAHDAREAGVNFSQVMQKALMRELGIKQVSRKRSR